MSVDEKILNAIQEAKGAERVTLQDVTKNIKATFVGRASELYGVSDIKNHPLQNMTIAVIVLQNNFLVTGESACADLSMYSKEVGEKIAIDNAVKKVWALMGYALKEKLYQVNETSYKERLVNEKYELELKFNKLDEFIHNSLIFPTLTFEEKQELMEQLRVMRQYLAILIARLNK